MNPAQNRPFAGVIHDWRFMYPRLVAVNRTAAPFTMKKRIGPENRPASALGILEIKGRGPFRDGRFFRPSGTRRSKLGIAIQRRSARLFPAKSSRSHPRSALDGRVPKNAPCSATRLVLWLKNVTILDPRIRIHARPLRSPAPGCGIQIGKRPSIAQA